MGTQASQLPPHPVLRRRTTCVGSPLHESISATTEIRSPFTTAIRNPGQKNVAAAREVVAADVTGSVAGQLSFADHQEPLAVAPFATRR